MCVCVCMIFTIVQFGMCGVPLQCVVILSHTQHLLKAVKHLQTNHFSLLTPFSAFIWYFPRNYTSQKRVLQRVQASFNSKIMIFKVPLRKRFNYRTTWHQLDAPTPVLQTLLTSMLNSKASTASPSTPVLSSSVSSMPFIRPRYSCLKRLALLTPGKEKNAKPSSPLFSPRDFWVMRPRTWPPDRSPR